MDKEVSNKKLKINKISMKSSLAETNENSLYLKFINFLARSNSNFEDEYQVQTETVDKIFESISLKKTFEGKPIIFFRILIYCFSINAL